MWGTLRLWIEKVYWAIIHLLSDWFMKYGLVPNLVTTVSQDQVLALFPQHEYLAEHFSVIQREVLDFHDGKYGSFRDTLETVAFGDDARDLYSGWKCHLLQAGMRHSAGNETRTKMPTLMGILDTIHAESPSVLWSGLFLLEPGQCIEPHKDTYSNVMQYHLPITVPTREPNETLVMNVAQHSFQVREGQAFCFNGRHTHSVENTLREPRIHLIIDVLVDNSLIVRFVNCFIIIIIQSLSILNLIADVDLYCFAPKDFSSIQTLRADRQVAFSPLHWLQNLIWRASRIGKLQ